MHCSCSRFSALSSSSGPRRSLFLPLTGYQNEEGRTKAKKSILGLKINRFLSFARLDLAFGCVEFRESLTDFFFSRKSSINTKCKSV